MRSWQKVNVALTGMVALAANFLFTIDKIYHLPTVHYFIIRV